MTTIDAQIATLKMLNGVLRQTLAQCLKITQGADIKMTNDLRNLITYQEQEIIELEAKLKNEL